MPRSTPLASVPRLFFTVLVALALPACAATPLDPRVAATVDVKSADPPPGCRYLGSVRGNAPLGELEDANIEAARTALLAGGNYVAVDFVEHPVAEFVMGYAVRGRLFACPAKTPPPAAPPPAAPPPAAAASAGFAAPAGPCSPPAPCAAPCAPAGTTPPPPCAATAPCTNCSTK